MKKGYLKINFPIIQQIKIKRKLLLLTSEERLKELGSIYQLVPADPYKKIESTK